MSDHRHDIEKYLKGELTSAERHALEKKALNDPFLADALEGAEQINAADFFNDVAQLNARIAGKKTVSVWMWTARIAAGLAFILVATFIVWSVLDTEPGQELALKKNNPVETPPAKNDSVTSLPETSSAAAEQSTAGPTSGEKDAPKQQPVAPAKTEIKPLISAKPTDTSADIQIKNEPVTEAIASKEAEEKISEKVAELKVTESLAQAGKTAESFRAKAEDDQETRAKSLRSTHTDKKKEAAPSAADRSAGAAGFVATTRVVQGKITSAEDGSPLPGVNVVIKNSTIGTATDADGNYQIKVDDPNPTLVFSFIGLKTTEENVNDRQQVDVALQLDVTQLSEVVSTGYGSQSTGESVPPTVDLAHPEIGNRAFKQYLEKNIRYPELAKTNQVEGRVTVEFTIEPNGSLTNFIVIRGIGSGCDEELIRLIKEGPKWIPTKRNDVPVQDKAKVRLKFELPK
jgi:TonB family protein